jgi:hypothetical protein
MSGILKGYGQLESAGPCDFFFPVNDTSFYDPY